MYQFICQNCRVVLAVVESDDVPVTTPVCPDHPHGFTELVEVREEGADGSAVDS